MDIADRYGKMSVPVHNVTLYNGIVLAIYVQRTLQATFDIQLSATVKPTAIHLPFCAIHMLYRPNGSQFSLKIWISCQMAKSAKQQQ